MKYDPKRIPVASFAFIIGVLLTWWFSDKISVFTGFFNDIFPQIMIWAIFLLLFGGWTILLPYSILTGADLSVVNTLKSLVEGLKGLAVLLVALPIAGVLFPMLANIFGIDYLGHIGWIVVIILVIYTSLFRPYEKLVEVAN